MKTFQSTKTYGHDLGLSVAFRQWRADSHCQFLHGYALAIKLTFECSELDERNWVVDFGGLKTIKEMLVNTFDHKTVIAEDDPELEWFQQGDIDRVLDLVVIPDTGCEKFAEYIFGFVNQWLAGAGYKPRCWLASVEVKEHGANSALVINKKKV